MKVQPRLLVAAAVLFALAALLVVRRDQTAPALAASYTGVAQIAGPLQLDVSVSPPVGTPRDVLRLRVTLTNYQSAVVSPNVLLQLPAVLRVNMGDLPAGATMNLATNSIQWLPVVPPNGQWRDLALDLEVSATDLTHPEQTLTAMLRTDDQEASAAAVLWIGIPPRVRDFAGPMRVSVGQPLRLRAELEGPGPFTSRWDLGDGRHVDVNEPEIVYPAAGVYEVTLTAKNPLGAASRTEQITVIPHAAALFAASDDRVSPGQAITFANRSGGQGPVRYQWEFGDGRTSTEAQPQHSYATPGSYLVRLVVENAFGRSETNQTIVVGAPPAADIVVAEQTAAGEHITGEVKGDPAQTEYVWSMGDGRRYDGTKVSHAFRQQGDYYVTVTARNEFGSTEVGRWVHVKEGTLKVFLPLVSNLSGLSSGSSAEAPLPAAGAPPVPEVLLDDVFALEALVFPAGTSPTSQLLAYVNEARRQFELGKLTAVSELAAAAQQHAADMAAAGHTQHTGTDGSTPRDRFLQFGYPRGYAGEATAWGFADPRQAVQFWVNSPGHRPIILNPYATEIGLGHMTDYSAPSVWYWTAEFGNGSGAAEAPLLRVQGPAEGQALLNTDTVDISWNWPRPLATTEQFTVYFRGANGRTAIATVKQPLLGTRYGISLQPLSRPDLLGLYEWQVVLENNRGVEVLAGAPQTLSISVDPDLPTATPRPTATITAVTVTPQPTATILATPTGQPAAPQPAEPTIPPLIIATPLPTPEP